MRHGKAESKLRFDPGSDWTKVRVSESSAIKSLFRSSASLLRAIALRVAVLILATAFLACAAAQVASPQTGVPRRQPTSAATSPYRIFGVAVNAITGEPIPRCRIVLSVAPWMARDTGQPSAAGPANTAEADDQGRFSVEVPNAGHWRLAGSARGFRIQAYEEHAGYFSAVVVSQAAPTSEVTLRLMPDAAIEGTVLDEAGEPVRGAQVGLISLPAFSPDQRNHAPQQRSSSITDDRGHYEFLEIQPGEYALSLRAQPWYAATARQTTPRGNDDVESPLDVVYPLTWFPGVTDFAAATPLTMQAGERRLADFHLLPVAGYRLRIPLAADETNLHRMIAVDGNAMGGGIGDAAGVTWLTQLAPDGSEQPASVSMTRTPQGGWEISGLESGTYQLHRESTDPLDSSLLEIRPGSGHALDLSATTPPASIAITLELNGTPMSSGGTAVGPSSIQVSLVNLATGRPTFAQRNIPPMRTNRITRAGAPDATDTDAMPTNLPDEALRARLVPGRYEVVLSGGAGDLYLTKINGSGAEATGRLVDLHPGEAKLVLHLTRGRASVRGVVKRDKLPDVGAMVLLVPATFGSKDSLTVLRRDQTNSDGSFELEDVIPGAYILVAIDHGWAVNWSDPTTLRRYLLRGIAMDLTQPAEVQRELEAQGP